MTEPNAPAALFQTIVVGTDFSACSEQAVDMAAKLVLAAPAGRLFVAHTFELPVYPGAELYMVDMFTPLKKAAQEQMARVVAELKARRIDVQGIVSVGPAWDCIVQAADKQRADLVVVGTHGRSGFKRALLGSVAEKVVRTSTVPVLTVRGNASEG